MRAELPGSPHWIEYRGDLTVGDIDAWNEPIERLWADRASEDSGEDEMEVSEDGLTMKPKPKPPVRITTATLRERRDGLLARTITAWSFQDLAPLPYSGASRDVLPAAAVPLLKQVYDALTDAIDGLEGPKETTPPTTAGDGSATTSTDESASPLPA